MKSASTRSQQIEAILRQTVDRFGFIASVLTTPNGLPLSSALREERDLSDILAAVAPVIEQAAQRSSERSGLYDADEVAIRGADRTLLVCRFFTIKGEPLILASIVPKNTAYRKAMNTTIRTIRETW